MTKTYAKQIIAQQKDNTSYYDNTLTYTEMYEMFRYRFQFGEAETACIISALVLSGAKFKEE